MLVNLLPLVSLQTTLLSEMGHDIGAWSEPHNTKTLQFASMAFHLVLCIIKEKIHG
jgi:hypothetical protein